MKQSIRFMIVIAALCSGVGTLPCIAYLIWGAMMDESEVKPTAPVSQSTGLKMYIKE